MVKSISLSVEMKILIFLIAVGFADPAYFNVSQEDFDNLVKQVSLLEATVEGLEDQNASTIKKIADLEAAAEDQEYEIEELRDEIGELKEQNQNLQAENENLVERVTRLEVRFYLCNIFHINVFSTMNLQNILRQKRLVR